MSTSTPEPTIPTTPQPPAAQHPVEAPAAAPQVEQQQVTAPAPVAAPAPVMTAPAPYAGQPSPAYVDQRVMMADAAAIAQEKSVGVAYLLWFFLGALGAHKFYLGRIGMGFAYFFTFGFLTIGLWIDLFTLARQTRQANNQRRGEIRLQMGV